MQFSQLKRREFITLLGSAAAWPLTAPGQNGRMARIAFLNASSPQAWDPHNMEQFKQGLEENSLVEGRNITIDYVWAEGNAERLRQRLNAAYSPIFIQQYDSPDGLFYRVRVGKVPGEDAAHQFGEQLRNREGFTPMVVRMDEGAAAGGMNER